MSQVQNIPYAELEVGQKAEYTSSIAERDLQLFAAVSGDRNPVHLDAAYAATTQFKERIAHGMLSGALISAAIATVLPGPGTIYLGQTLRFTRPVKLGDDLKVELEVLEEAAEEPRAHGHAGVQPGRQAGGRRRSGDHGAGREAQRRAGRTAADQHRLSSLPCRRAIRPGGLAGPPRAALPCPLSYLNHQG